MCAHTLVFACLVFSCCSCFVVTVGRRSMRSGLRPVALALVCPACARRSVEVVELVDDLVCLCLGSGEREVVVAVVGVVGGQLHLEGEREKWDARLECLGGCGVDHADLVGGGLVEDEDAGGHGVDGDG